LSHRLPRRAQLWLRDRRMNARIRAGDAAGLLPELGILVPERELKRVFDDAWTLLAERRQGSEPGDYLEFGVYAGTSMACMHEVLEQRGLDEVRLFGFDSFEGLPADTHSDDTSRIESWKAGDFKAPYELCRANLTQKGVNWDRTTLVKGFFEDTLAPDMVRQHGIRKAGVIMVDSDLYSSAKTALEFCAPLIGDHAVILFDDWWPDTLGAARTGERRAFEEVLADHPDMAAEELDSYAPESAKVFLVSRVTAPVASLSGRRRPA
jgi:O-methyltransferase